MTSPVTIVRSVLLNCLAIVPLFRAQLETLEEASEHGTVLMAARIPGNDRFTVPIRLRVSYPPPKTARFGLTIAARTMPALHPRFRGDLELADAGTAATKFTLSGEYHVPLGPLERAFDVTVARGIAPRGLEDLLDRMIADVVADVARDSDVVYRAEGRSE
jgi:hypothetical protein